MAKETEKRLIRTLEFLKEPQGSTIPTIVKAMNGEGPQVSLKRIVQTLRGCLENGLLRVSDGRVKLREVSLLESELEDDNQLLKSCGRTRSGCAKPVCPSKPVCTMKAPSKCPPKKVAKPKCPKLPPKGGSNPCPDNPDGGPENMDQGEAEGESNCNPCPPCPQCPKKKKKNKCVKKKLRCPKPKKKPKCSKPKKKPKKKAKKCPKKKIQPYCKKKKK